MASLISKVVVRLARSRIRVSSQRGWWCLDQSCSVIADFSGLETPSLKVILSKFARNNNAKIVQKDKKVMGMKDCD